MTATSSPPGDPPERRSPGDRVVSQAIDILNRHRTMAISTLRPDGWPQTTIVGFVNEGLSVYFMIARSSQKYSNIQKDDRVSIAVGQEPREISDAKAVYAGAYAAEIRIRPSAPMPGSCSKSVTQTSMASRCQRGVMPR